MEGGDYDSRAPRIFTARLSTLMSASSALQILRAKRLRRWWQEDTLGTIALTVRYRAEPIEFKKGKRSVIVPAKEQLVDTIDTIIAAVKAGELDPHLAQQAKARVAPKAKRAA